MLNKLKFCFPLHTVLVPTHNDMWMNFPSSFSVIGTIPNTGFLSRIFKRKTVMANLADTVGSDIGYTMGTHFKGSELQIVVWAIKTVVNDKN